MIIIFFNLFVLFVSSFSSIYNYKSYTYLISGDREIRSTDKVTDSPPWLIYSRTSMARKPMAHYHGYFERVLESLGTNPIAADISIFGIIKGDIL